MKHLNQPKGHVYRFEPRSSWSDEAKTRVNLSNEILKHMIVLGGDTYHIDYMDDIRAEQYWSRGLRSPVFKAIPCVSLYTENEERNAKLDSLYEAAEEAGTLSQHPLVANVQIMPGLVSSAPYDLCHHECVGQPLARQDESNWTPFMPLLVTCKKLYVPPLNPRPPPLILLRLAPAS